MSHSEAVRKFPFKGTKPNEAHSFVNCDLHQKHVRDLMKIVSSVLIVLSLLWPNDLIAQSNGSKSGDPAAGSAAKGLNTGSTGTSSATTRSGSGMSSSGGRDDNGDQGRDAMQDPNRGDVRKGSSNGKQQSR
jgi:hypothetical protein